MWGRVTIFLTRLQGNQEIWRVNGWRLKCVISKYHEIHLQCTILTIKVVYLFWCFWCFGGLCEEHSPPGPGLPVSLALGQHHGILCQAAGVHAVWICLDSTFEIQEQSQPTNQPNRSLLGDGKQNLPTKRPPRNGCGGWYLQMLREELWQPAVFATKKSKKSSTFIQTSDWYLKKSHH